MRFVHTSDWHLGKSLHQRSLLADQAEVLETLKGHLRDAAPDALVVAGDVYDRAVPPADAVRLLDDFLSEVALGLRIPVLMIAGNHDGPERLGFGARLLEERGVHLAGPMLGPCPSPVFRDAHGPVAFHLLPYADPATVQLACPYEDPRDHQRATSALTAAARARTPSGARSVCVAHAFVVGGSESESERPLSVGGSGAVRVETFDGFDYVALGHLHRPQQAGRPEVRYSGSLLPYAFSEIDHDKGALLVDLDGEGRAKVETLPLPPPRPFRRIEGTLRALCETPVEHARDAYLQVVLTDHGALLDALGRLREVYPHVLDLQRTFLMQRPESVPLERDAVRGGRVDLFADFVRHVGGGDLGEGQRALVAEVFAAARAGGAEE